MRGLVLAAGALALFGCGGGGGDGATPPPPKPPTAQASTVSVNVLGTSASAASDKVTASDPQGLALTYTVATPPSVGTVTLDAKSGAFMYVVSGQPGRPQDSFVVSVSNGQAAAVTATVTVQLNSDPLLANQWHLRNTGASAFSTTLPVAGNDMNVAGAWAAGFSGKGVKIGVVDTGLETSHEDLAANVDLANSFNFLTNGNDPTPAASEVGSDHGTEVAGIIGAVAFNGKGGRGVAYGARVRGYNLVALNTFSAAQYGTAMGSQAISSDNAIFNASWGTPGATLATPASAFDSVVGNLNGLRGNLGALHINSAGNNFGAFEGEASTANATLCASARRFGVSCGDPVQTTQLSTPGPIVVGAINAHGTRASYSSTGSSLWVSAPGGEFGFDAAYYKARALAPVELEPAIVTTARTGCANKLHTDGVANALVSGSNALALNCQYTAQMNGTSAAAPNVSGVVALMLEANPKLTARDVKFILAKTATPVDAALPAVTTTTLLNGGAALTLEQGWVKNAAGFSFSNAYGFGAVNAAAAVDLARTYTTNLPAAKSASSELKPLVGRVVPARSASGFAYSSTVGAVGFTTVEQLVLRVRFDSTPALQCNQVEVVSPAGTRSILLHAATGYVQPSADVRLLSNAFYGEPVQGVWKVTYLNVCANPTVLSVGSAQSIEFFGR